MPSRSEGMAQSKDPYPGSALASSQSKDPYPTKRRPYKPTEPPPAATVAPRLH
jgi:hypothetical protein